MGLMNDHDTDPLLSIDSAMAHAAKHGAMKVGYDLVYGRMQTFEFRDPSGARWGYSINKVQREVDALAAAGKLRMIPGGWPTERLMSDYIAKRRYIDPGYAVEIDLTKAKPALVASLANTRGEVADIVVDGAHRIFAAAIKGLRAFPAYRVPAEIMEAAKAASLDDILRLSNEEFALAGLAPLDQEGLHKLFTCNGSETFRVLMEQALRQ